TRRKTAQGLALRARIVLACAEGHSNTAVSARLGIRRGTVTRWCARFLAGRLDGLSDEPRPGVSVVAVMAFLTDQDCGPTAPFASRQHALTAAADIDCRAPTGGCRAVATASPQPLMHNYSFGMGTEGANGPLRSGPADRQLLTPREREVAELVAAG